MVGMSGNSEAALDQDDGGECKWPFYLQVFSWTISSDMFTLLAKASQKFKRQTQCYFF